MTTNLITGGATIGGGSRHKARRDAFKEWLHALEVQLSNTFGHERRNGRIYTRKKQNEAITDEIFLNQIDYVATPRYLKIRKVAVLRTHALAEKYPSVSRSDHQPVMTVTELPESCKFRWLRRNDNYKGWMPSNDDDFKT